MTKNDFIRKFKDALSQTINFTKTLIIDDLTSNYKFNVYRADLKYSKKRLSFEEAVDELFQNNKFPKWINIGVMKVDGNITVIKCDYSEIFTNNERVLFPPDPFAPFSITGPTTSRVYPKGEKFHLENFIE